VSSEFERGVRAAREACLRRSMRYDHQDRQENALSGEAYECAEDIAVLLPAETAQSPGVPVPARASSVEDAFREGFGKGTMAGVCVCADHDAITRDEAWGRSAAKALIMAETIPDGAEWRLTPLGEKALFIASGAAGCAAEQKIQIAWDIYREFRGLYPAPVPVAEPPADAEVAQARPPEGGCSNAADSWACEAQCQEPHHVDDGVPYCDKCGLYRQTIARQRSAAAKEQG
jgi:hypothetical protein